jgi:hypothetical protein
VDPAIAKIDAVARFFVIYLCCVVSQYSVIAVTSRANAAVCRKVVVESR